ncbi:MAG: septum formation initiator family protein [Desulfobulbaceae bacterium]|nr:septum formation initiator family protein [Desulfobulbaceae bacterium]MCK5404665.1 septum formation initiator family protein [Desulfobulbaceae bacterium]
MFRLTPHNRQLLTVCSFLLLLLAIWLFFSPYGGILKYHKTSEKLNSIRTENEILKKQNAALEKEIAKLTKDPSYQAEIARKKHGMIKKNEIIFDFDKK